MVFVGDSLAGETAQALRMATAGREFVRKFMGGTAPRDWIDVDLEATATSVVLVGRPYRHPAFEAEFEVNGINAVYQQYAAASRVSSVDAAWCPVYSSGATRFGLGIAAAANDPATFD